MKNDANVLFPVSSQIDTSQSLDDILEGLKKTMNEIPPPRFSKEVIFDNWELIKSIRKEDIMDLVKKINNLSNNAIHEKVKEIEQLALRLDMAQTTEFNEGENMKIMKT